MSLTNDKIAVQVFRLINKIIFLEKKNIFEFENVKLYPSEIHLMLLIHQEQNTNVTKMADNLGVTKGAVSQTLSRLERKRILQKVKNRYNKNELTVIFTTSGKKAIERYLYLRKSTREKHEKYLSALSEYDRQIISGFLKNIELMIPENK